MKRYLPLFASLSLSAEALEHTVQSEEFEKSFSIEAKFFPSEVTLLELEPKQWANFKVKELIAHGSQVKKGDLLISFETEEFEKALLEATQSAKSRALSLATTQRELADLEITTPQALEAEELKFARTKEAFDHYQNEGMALEIEQAEERLDRARRSLSYAQEELKQLLKMYEEDGITEETEEIILKRQKSTVKSAELALKAAQQATQWELEKTIPRKAHDLKIGMQSATLAYETAKLNIPRILEQKRITVAKAIRDAQEADDKLKELESDQELLSLRAPSDGLVYYGKIDNGSWSIENTSKYLFEKGMVPADSVFMSLVPELNTLTLHATLNQEQRLTLPSEAKGLASVKGMTGASYSVELSKMDLAPQADGTYKISLKATLPKGHAIVTGMNATVKLITYQNDKAIVIPQAALTEQNGKNTVRIKMADGKTELRTVQTGHQFENKIEILEGLSVDQVILLPDAQ